MQHVRMIAGLLKFRSMRSVRRLEQKLFRAALITVLQVIRVEEGMADVVFRLKSLVNSLSPVNQLPPEVFATVLAHRWPGRDLISATHVCRYWRETLLSFPSLWAEVPCGPASEEQTFSFLVWARAVPLHIYSCGRISLTLLSVPSLPLTSTVWNRWSPIQWSR